MKHMTRLAHLQEGRSSSSHDSFTTALERTSPLQNYVDEVGHHQTYTAELISREPSLTRLNRNIEQLEMMNSRLEFMMDELSSLTRRFR